MKTYEQSHTAQQIISDASESTGSAGSYHVTLDEATSEGSAHLDLDVEGTNVRGKITGPSISLRVIHADGLTFVNGSDLAASIAPIDADGAVMIKAAAGDKWVLMSAGFWDSSLTNVIDMKNLSSCLQTAGGLNKRGTSTVSGRSAVEVDDQKSSQFFVDTASPHYLVHADITGADRCVTDATATSEIFDWSKFGEKFGIAAPSGYVDLSQIG